MRVRGLGPAAPSWAARLVPLALAIAWLAGCGAAPASPATAGPARPTAAPTARATPAPELVPVPPTARPTPSPTPSPRPTPTPTPRAVAYHFAEGIPAPLRAAVADFARRRDLPLDRVEGVGRAGERRANLSLTTAPPPPGYAAFELAPVSLAPVVQFGRWERALGPAALREVVAGRVRDWSALGAPPEPLELVLDRETAALVARALGTAAPTPLASSDAGRTAAPRADRGVVVARSPGEVVEYVSTHHGALGIVPVASLSVEVRALPPPGCDLFRRDQACWVSSALWLGVEPDAFSPAELADLRASLLAASADLAPRPTSLAAAGDLIFGRRVDAKLVALGDYLAPFREVGPALSAADLTVADLETPLSDLVVPSHDPKTFTFATSAKTVAGLQMAGIDVVSLANNHSFNCGPAPFVDTLRVLDAAGIRHFGGGRNRAEAHRPAIVEAGGLRFAFLGYDDVTGPYYAAGERTPGLAPLDLPTVVADVRAARRTADVVVPYFHWGVEYTSVPTARQREVARAAVDAGAVLVLGSHPHWVQAVEFYHGGFIAYSLGNFVFDQDWSLETQQGMALEALWLGDRLAAVDLRPVRIHDVHQPRFLPPGSAEWREILGRVAAASGQGFR